MAWDSVDRVGRCGGMECVIGKVDAEGWAVAPSGSFSWKGDEED